MAKTVNEIILYCKKEVIYLQKRIKNADDPNDYGAMNCLSCRQGAYEAVIDFIKKG